MKKVILVIVLALVLVMAAGAEALTITLQKQGGGNTYVPGGSVTLEVVSSGLTGTGASRIGQLDMDITTDSAYADSPSVGTLHPTLANNLGWSNGTVGDYPLLIDNIVGRAAIGEGVGNVVLYTFDVTFDSGATGEITIALADLVVNNPFGIQMIPPLPVELTLVPEPMTAVLVGVGGLLLRRRRQAVRRTRALF